MRKDFNDDEDESFRFFEGLGWAGAITGGAILVGIGLAAIFWR